MASKDVIKVQSLIEQFLEKNRDRIVFSHKKGFRTHNICGSGLKIKVFRLMAFLSTHKIKKGDTIILFGSDYIEWIAVYFASILSGIVVVPLDIMTDKLLLKKINSQVNAKASFQDRSLASIGIRTFYLDEIDKYLDDGRAIPNNLQGVDIKESDVLEIMYTSGTTGDPKGVMLTHGNISAGICSAVHSIPLIIRLRILNLLPLSHIFGQVYCLFTAMHYSQHVFFIDTIQTRKLISFIRNKKINFAAVVPEILNAMRKELDGKSVMLSLGIQFRAIGVGGASLDEESEKWWRLRGIVVMQGYGLTETSSVVSINSLFRAKRGSVGRIAPGVEIKFGEDGEILVRGSNISRGYYRNEKKTKDSFEQEWFKTGDIGELKNGFLYIKERKKDIIVLGSGLKVYPIDIESVLSKIEGVKSSCVIEKDKKIHAVLLPESSANVPGIIEKANSILLSHQKISTYSLWKQPDFPRTHTGKIKKFIVKEEADKQKGRNYNYSDKLLEIINRVLKPHEKIKLNSKLAHIGMDSLKRVELISEIENEFGVEIDELKLNQDAKVSDLKNLIGGEKLPLIRFKQWQLSPMARACRFLFQRFFYYALIRPFTSTDYRGLENVRDIKRPVIFFCNHQSAWDGVLVGRKIPYKTAIAADADVVFGIGTKGSFFLRAYRKFTGYYTALFYNTYPFGSTISTSASLEFTGEFLDRNYSILIFPEGERTLDGKIHEFKSGIGYLALHMGVSLIPVRIEGLDHVLARGKIIPTFGKTSVKFGKAISPDRVSGLTYAKAAQLIEKKVREL